MKDSTIATVGIVGIGPVRDAIAALLTGADVRVADATDDIAPGGFDGCDLVIETLPDAREPKREALRVLDDALDPGVLLATTIGGQSVTDLASGLNSPDRVVGLVWHHAVEKARTVEVVPGLGTAESTVHTVAAWVEGFEDKSALIVEDRPGALLNSLLMPYLNDVVQAYDEDLATAEDLDLALRLGLGYRVGPLEMLERIGLERHHEATTAAHVATGDQRFASPPLLQRWVAAGQTTPRTPKDS